MSDPIEPAEPVSANAEAARYRVRLRETEAKLAEAESRISGMQRKSAESLLADKLAVPADLFDLGKVAVADLLSENGDIDSEALESAVSTLLESRPGLAAEKPPEAPHWGDVGGGRNATDPAPTMQDALRAAAR